MLKVKIVYLLFLLFSFTNCSDKNNNKLKRLNEGKDLYNVNCLSCHQASSDNTLYNPSLEQMSKTSESEFYVLLNKIKNDSIHSGINLFNNLRDRKLLDYIVNYKQDTAIP